MRNRLPSLLALRAFEVAGRLQSFSNAALELNVTQGAVSRQIRALEDELGVRLFNRLTRRVELTEEGRKYLQDVQIAFDRLEKGTEQIRAHQTHSILTISALPSVSTYLLMPRLASFTQRYPDIDTRINSSIDPVDLQSRHADVAIRVGPKPGRSYGSRQPAIDLVMTMDWRGVLAEELAPDVLVPVYSPNILAEGTRLADPEVFQHLPIIHTSSRSDAWAGWMKCHGLAELPATPRIEYGHFFMSLEAVRQGLGVALIPDVVIDHVDTSAMVVAREYSAPSAGEYYLLTLASRAQEPPIQHFREWTKTQFAGRAA